MPNFLCTVIFIDYYVLVKQLVHEKWNWLDYPSQNSIYNRVEEEEDKNWKFDNFSSFMGALFFEILGKTFYKIVQHFLPTSLNGKERIFVSVDLSTGEKLLWGWYLVSNATMEISLPSAIFHNFVVSVSSQHVALSSALQAIYHLSTKIHNINPLSSSKIWSIQQGLSQERNSSSFQEATKIYFPMKLTVTALSLIHTRKISFQCCHCCITVNFVITLGKFNYSWKYLRRSIHWHVSYTYE